MKNILNLILLSLITFKVTAQSSNKSNIFKSDIESVVIKNDTLNLDDYKDLILIPGGVQFREYFEKINYFTNYQPFDKFEKEIKKSEFKKEVGDFYGKNGLINAYTKYKKFLCLFIVREKDNTVKMKLYKPDTGDIFIVEGKSKTRVTGPNVDPNYISEEMYNSMMNELVSYIRANSKTYDK